MTCEIEILERLEGTRRAMRQGLDASCTQYRKEREDFRIKKL